MLKMKRPVANASMSRIVKTSVHAAEMKEKKKIKKRERERKSPSCNRGLSSSTSIKLLSTLSSSPLFLFSVPSLPK